MKHLSSDDTCKRLKAASKGKPLGETMLSVTDAMNEEGVTKVDLSKLGL